MSEKLQCQDCGKAEYGEDLYNYDGKILCRYCIVARVYEDSTPCEYVGICNDETFPNKTEQIDQLKQQLAEKDKEIEEKMMSFEKRCQEYYKSDEFKRDFAIQELEKVKEVLLDEYKKYPIVYDKTNDIVAGALDRDKVNEIIDQQIKELKGEK